MGRMATLHCCSARRTLCRSGPTLVPGHLVLSLLCDIETDSLVRRYAYTSGGGLCLRVLRLVRGAIIHKMESVLFKYNLQSESIKQTYRDTKSETHSYGRHPQH